MSVADTSMAVFIKVNITKNEEIVLDAIKVLEPCTNGQIADYLGWTENRVTGRTNGLERKSMILRYDKLGVTAMGNKAYRWVSKHPSDKQLSLIPEMDCFD